MKNLLAYLLLLVGSFALYVTYNTVSFLNQPHDPALNYGFTDSAVFFGVLACGCLGVAYYRLRRKKH